MFVFRAISGVFRIQIWGYKPYVRVSCDLCSTSHINLRLQTLCSCFVRFLQYFAYKSEVTNPMFVFSAISPVFRIQIWGYKPYVRFPCDFCNRSHINPRLQTLCSFWARFLLYFAYKSEVTNPMFIFSVVSVAFRIQIWGYKPYVRVSCDLCRYLFASLCASTWVWVENTWFLWYITTFYSKTCDKFINFMNA